MSQVAVWVIVALGAGILEVIVPCEKALTQWAQQNWKPVYKLFYPQLFPGLARPSSSASHALKMPPWLALVTSFR